MYYFTNKSLSVEHNDESQLSLESSSSPLPNQKLDDDDEEEDDGFDDDVEPFLYLDPVALFADLRRKPSIALPIMCGSTNALLLSQRKRLFDFGGLARSSLSLNRSSTSFENETVTLAVFRSDFFRAIGWWRFSNQPANDAALFLSLELPVTICLALCKIDTSKLFERFERDMPLDSGANVFADVDAFDLHGDVSSTLFISVADDANDVINDFKSVFVTTIPVRLKKLGDLAVFEPDVDGADAITGIFSDALRVAVADGIGANVEPTKSE